MLVVVVLTYAPQPGMLEACLASVVASGDADEVVLVDNGGSIVADDLPAGVHLVSPGRNEGYAGGMNVGIRWALEREAAAVALLNDDIEVEPGWLAPLVSALGVPGIGVAQPKLLLTGTDPAIVNSMGVQLDRFGAGSDIGAGELDGAAFSEQRTIELFTGGAILLSAAFLRTVGLFDERFFLYYEDVELGRRGRAFGWSYRCVPASRVWHRGSATASNIGDRASYLRERNRLWCVTRYGSFAENRRAWWLSVRRLRHPPHRAHLFALAAAAARTPGNLLDRRRLARTVSTRGL